MLSYLEHMNKPTFMEVWLWTFQRLQITILMDPDYRFHILLDAMNGVFIAWVNQEPSEHHHEGQMLGGQETLF